VLGDPLLAVVTLVEPNYGFLGAALVFAACAGHMVLFDPKPHGRAPIWSHLPTVLLRPIIAQDHAGDRIGVRQEIWRLARHQSHHRHQHASDIRGFGWGAFRFQE
jgi:hypothetical protein